MPGVTACAAAVLLRAAGWSRWDDTTLIEADGPDGLGFFTEEEFKEWVRPEDMVGPTPK
eukprot:SAG22_NODE_1_length_62449_cov_158.689270_32_plen_59_part_00